MKGALWFALGVTVAGAGAWWWSRRKPMPPAPATGALAPKPQTSGAAALGSLLAEVKAPPPAPLQASVGAALNPGIVFRPAVPTKGGSFDTPPFFPAVFELA